MTFLSAVLLLSCLPAALLDFAMPIWKADKKLQIEDAYKWTYQATRGGEHAAPDRGTAMKWLGAEWDSLTPELPGEDVWQPLCPDGSIGRLNLRPFRAAAGGRDALLNAFLDSARLFKSEPKSFISAWSEFGKRLKREPTWRITYQDWQRLDAQMKSKNYPAIHHSDAYNRALRPAYRILLKSEANKFKTLAH